MKENLKIFFGCLATVIIMITCILSVSYFLGLKSMNTEYKEYEMYGIVIDVREYYYTSGTRYNFSTDLLRDIQIKLDNGKEVTIKQKNKKSYIHIHDCVEIKYIEKYIFGEYVSSEYIIIE